MNYDPISFCFEGKHFAPTESMGYVSANKYRKACSECRERIRLFRLAAKSVSERRVPA